MTVHTIFTHSLEKLCRFRSIKTFSQLSPWDSALKEDDEMTAAGYEERKIIARGEKQTRTEKRLLYLWKAFSKGIFSMPWVYFYAELNSPHQNFYKHLFLAA